VFACWQQWEDNQGRIKRLQQNTEEMTAQAQLIGYQVTELDEIDPQPGESDELEAEFQRLNNADSTLASLSEALLVCRNDDGEDLAQSIARARDIVAALADKDPALTGTKDLLNTAAIQIDEATTELQRFQDKVEINPEKLEAVNQRLAELHRVARKHKIKPAELSLLHENLKVQLAGFQNADLDLEQFMETDAQLRSTYSDLAGKLSQQRSQASKKLAKQINKQLKDLGMSDAALEINLTAAELAELPNPRANGQENVEFLVSTNPGQPAKPLIKIASGGELSRISLAIQVITAKTSRIPTLVFDEVDVGIGGGVAKAVGRLLRELASHTQILCVTHQAQVASAGDQHYFVSKQTDGAATYTAINELNDQQKIKEIARMLGGEEFSDESLAHAEQMVANS
jgi:DNA repair protein RecN (Recombination protein N)